MSFRASSFRVRGMYPEARAKHHDHGIADTSNVEAAANSEITQTA